MEEISVILDLVETEVGWLEVICVRRTVSSYLYTGP